MPDYRDRAVPTRRPLYREVRRPLQYALVVLAAFVSLTTLVACQDVASTTPTPARPVAAAALEKVDVDAWLDGMLPAALKRVGIAGAGVAVVDDGKILTSRGYGWADVGTDSDEPVPVDPARTLFRVGSLSKVVTATAVLQMVESGQLDLDTDVRTYLDFGLKLDQGPVTLRHLLTHTAGFEDRVAGLVRLDGASVDLKRMVSTDPPAQIYRPGTVPAYSNYGSALAGYVVERVSQVPFADYVGKAVLTPAGMTSASFKQPLPPDLARQMSRGYPDASSAAGPFEHLAESPAGALSATTNDMAAFMLAQLGEPVSGGPVLGEKWLHLMQAPALGTDALGDLADGPRMTLGFLDESRNGQRILGHGGDTQFFHSHLQIYPAQGAGIFITLNSSGTGPLDTLEVRNALMEGFADRYFPSPGTPTRTSVDPAESLERARMAAGMYRSSRSMQSNFLSVVNLTATVRVDARPDGQLAVQPAHGLPTMLYQEVAPWSWQEVGGQHVLTMRTVGNAVTAIGTGPTSTLLPISPVRSPAVAVPVLMLSSAVLIGVVLGWVVAAIHRHGQRPLGVTWCPRTARLLTRVGSTLALAALVSWLLVLQLVVGLHPVPFVVLRLLQLIQLVSVLTVAPAAVVVVQSLRSRAGWWRTSASVLVLLALVGIGWFAVAFRLLAQSVSY